MRSVDLHGSQKTATASGSNYHDPRHNADEAFLCGGIATAADLVKPVKKWRLAESMRKAAGLLPGPKQPLAPGPSELVER